jgi:hypothetical protein
MSLTVVISYKMPRAVSVPESCAAFLLTFAEPRAEQASPTRNQNKVNRNRATCSIMHPQKLAHFNSLY